MKSATIYLATLILLAIALAPSAAQEPDPADAPPTLPEVLVEPEDEEIPPPAELAREDDFDDFDAQNNDSDFDDILSQTFPSLTDQTFGGLTGGLRGPSMSLFDTPRAVDIVTQQQLTEKSPLDIGQALEQTPGVLIQRTGRGQSSPYIRGLTGQQVLIMIDGVRATNATFRAGPNQYFNTIDPNMVERIEVIRGPGSVLYGGDALGGVINVVTKSANNVGYDFTTGSTVQRFSTADLGYTGRLNVEGWVGSVGVFAGGGMGNYNNLDIGGQPDAPPGFNFPGRQPATSWRYNSGDIKFNYRLDDSSELIVSLQHYEANDVFRSDRFPAMRQTIFDPQSRDLVYLRWQGHAPCCSLFDTYQLTASLQQFDENRFDRDFRMGANPDLRQVRGFTDEQTGVTAAFTRDLCALGVLTYGADWYHDEIGSLGLDIDGSVTPPTVTPVPGNFPNDGYYSRYGVYLNWDVWLTPQLLMSTGTRFEHVTAGATVNVNKVDVPIDPEYQGVVGNIGLTYELSPCVHFVGSVSEGFRAPNLDDLAAVNGNVFVGTQLPNPNLQPETSITYEVGVKTNTDRIRTQTFVWWTDLQNFIDTSAPNTMDLLSRSNTDAFLNGVEFNGEYLFDCNWSLYGNFWYTYGQNTVLNEPLSRIPPSQGIVGLRWRDDGGANWWDFYAWLVDEQDRLSARDISDVNRIPPGGTPGYATFNIRYGRLLAPRHRIAVNFENIFDEQYRVHGSGVDGPGIGAVLTYEVLR